MDRVQYSYVQSRRQAECDRLYESLTREEVNAYGVRFGLGPSDDWRSEAANNPEYWRSEYRADQADRANDIADSRAHK